MKVFIKLCQELREGCRLNKANIEAELTIFLLYKKHDFKPLELQML